MKLLFYSATKYGELEQSLGHDQHGWDFIEFPDLAQYLAYLGKPLVSYEHLALLIVHDPRELDLLIDNRHLSDGLEVLLILAGDNRQLASKAHLLSPKTTFLGVPSPETMLSLLNRVQKNRHMTKAVWMGGQSV